MTERIMAMQEAHNQVHVLKAWPEYFKAVRSGTKTFEVRKDDRGGFHVGDVLFLHEWDPTAEKYTGQRYGCVVVYVLPGGQFGIEQGYAVLGIAP